MRKLAVCDCFLVSVHSVFVDLSRSDLEIHPPSASTSHCRVAEMLFVRLAVFVRR